MARRALRQRAPGSANPKPIDRRLPARTACIVRRMGIEQHLHFVL